MKTAIKQPTGRRAPGSGLPLTITLLLLAPLAARADKSYTATGWVTGVPVLPIIVTNGASQVGLRGNAHTARVVASDTRLTGHRLVFANGNYQADGTALIYGTGYQQVGSFDTNNNFTPSAGLWEITFSGVMQTDNSLQLTLVGYGSGGVIDGMRIQETLTRGPAAGPIDPAVPYLYTGTLKPKPVDTRVVLDNFDDNILTRWRRAGTGAPYALTEANKQFTVRGQWAGLRTVAHGSTYAWGVKDISWGVLNNATLEWRVDLVGMTENATNAAAIVVGSWADGKVYLFYKGRDYVQIGKWLGSSMALFSHEKAVIKNTNVVLSFAMTPRQSSLVLTARVLDKDNQNAVLYEHSVVDTPQVDPTLTQAELLALSGMNLSIGADVSGAPYFLGDGVALDAWQYTDGNQPVLDVTYDNLELWTYELPRIGIERAVRLSWPGSATPHYAVEAAPTLQGPWQPVQDPEIPGFQRITVPASGPMEIFRLVPAP